MVVTTETECKEIVLRSCYCSFFSCTTCVEDASESRSARMCVVLERITSLRVFGAVVQLRGDENRLFAFA